MKHLTITVPIANAKCQFSVAHLDLIRAYLEPLNGRAVTVRFERPRSTRSLKQNAYYWGVVLTMIASETGNNTEDLHAVYKDMLLPRKFVKLGKKEIEVRRTTTDLNPTEFNAYIEAVVAHAAQELGIRIPQPGE